jgi:hypothetical protein
MTVRALQSAWNTARGGAQVTISTLEEGVIVEPPASLAKDARAPLDVYSLARMIRSEGYGGAAVGKAAAGVSVAQCAKHRAARLGKTSTAMLTASTKEPGRGRYGRQSSSYGGTRYAATTLDPRVWEISVATAVMAGDLNDLVKGSTSFLDPAVFASGGTPEHRLRSFESVMKAWHGFVVPEHPSFNTLAWAGPIPTIDPFYLLTFRKEHSQAVRRESLQRVMKVYQEGSKGPAPGDPDAKDGAALIAGIGLAVKKGIFKFFGA